MDLHPEKKPQVGPVERFVVSTGAIQSSKEDINLQIEALEERIKTLVDKFTVTWEGHPVPILDKILAVSHNRSELKGLAKALDRAADLVGTLDDLYDQRRVVELVERKPHWLAWTFGSFEDIDLQTALTDLSNE